MKFFIIILSLITFTFNSWANFTCPENREDYFCLTPEMAPNSEVQIVDFYSIPVKIISLFQVELKKLEAPLLLEAKWESPFFGAGVSFYEGQYRLMILGGLSRIEGMSLDAYSAVVCHELGHLLGGYPYQTIAGAEWSSSEGQSDYFAASTCLPRLFRAQGVEEAEIPRKVEQAGFHMLWAIRAYDSSSDSDSLNKLTRYKSDPTKVGKTLINVYPTLQCRYENFRNAKKRPSCWFKD